MTAQDWDLSEDEPWIETMARRAVQPGAWGKAFVCCLSEMIEIEGSHDADCPEKT